MTKNNKDTIQAMPLGAGLGKTGTYTVQSGDNLFLIAKKFRTSVASLLLNNNVIDPERLQPGEILNISATSAFENFLAALVAAARRPLGYADLLPMCAVVLPKIVV